jgi:hypothetical protein
MSTQPLPHPDHDQPPEPEPDTVATPEGDNEDTPDTPLSPSTTAAPIRPRGDQPHTEEPLYPALNHHTR